MPLRLNDVAVRFHHPLITADGTFAERRSVLVALEQDGIVGWGEAAAFPSGRWGTIDEAWEALTAWDPADDLPVLPLAGAAAQAARVDLAARIVGQPLCVFMGGASQPVRARLTTGLAASPDELVARLEGLTGSGARAVKVKVAPGRDIEPIRAARASFPDLDISVDANGSYRDADDPAFDRFDAVGVTLIEQPLPPGDLAGCARLRRRLSAAVCIDEDLRTVADAHRVLAAGAADVLAVKLMRLGWDAALHILSMCRDAGVGVKAGGTFDTAVGRHHVLAFATQAGVVDAEAGPPAAYLVDPLGDYPQFDGGTITPVDAPGIGPGPDRELVQQATIRSGP